ncbi:hypothetical protein SAMD00023353_2000240 [Rosellinia necatrix]|uniref:T6SS Phospholipase effector Tle1-like catalytic domain-containing protein n=1 Tax=Rosellinia necatrix TaxID=77044 RepID=A0A1W2TF71_ROSNE|nr:hypothetical protein SAMD00023353_2000240 [Rosellinia necatrix]
MEERDHVRTENRPNDEQPRLPRALRALKNSKDAKNHPRTLLICLDGTGDQFDNDNSNVVHFVSCLKKHCPERQMTYYQSGIGTYDKGGLSNGIGAAMDMAVGSGLGTHIKDAYRYLMQNYREGDKICLIGFSRGAYTVRCLAGMIHKVGLLPASNGSQVNFAYNFYKDDSENGTELAEQFKKTFCTEVSVYFLGLFDCVASVGFFPRKLPFSKTATNTVRYFRHAMALDEHRAKFKVCHWQNDQPGVISDIKRRATIDFTPVGRLRRLRHNKTPAGMSADQPTHLCNHDEVDDSSDGVWDSKFEAQERANRRDREIITDALEVWFMGAHADIGGGAVKNESRHMLSRIPLRWMIRQCFECDTGVVFDMARLAEQGLDVVKLWPEYQPPTKPTAGPSPRLMTKYNKGTLAPVQRRSVFLPIGHKGHTIDDAPTREALNYVLPSESDEDHFDAMQPPNDQLKIAKGWWILEVWPVKIRVLSNDKEGWEKRVRFNLGRRRGIRDRAPNMHWTVQKMIDNGSYTLRNRETNGTKWREVV